MSKWAYYNEVEPFCVEWLKNLIRKGVIAPGEVDNRSIVDVRADDLKGFAQQHFFAGIGVWSRGLRLAGWPDSRPVFTGSCPCQPFSVAGQKEGTTDPRHLWPEWFRLIREYRPVAIFGEQVAAAIRHGWLDLVQTDLEGEGYAVGAAIMGAHSVGAPHIRQRLFFMAHDNERGRGVERAPRLHDHGQSGHDADGRGENGLVADAQRGTAERRGHQMGGAQGGAQGEVWQQRLRHDAGDGEPAGISGKLALADGVQSEQSAGSGAGSGAPEGTGQHGEPAGPGEAGKLAHDNDQRERSIGNEEGGLGEAVGGGLVGESGLAGLEGHSRDGDHWHQPGRLHAIEAGPVATPSPTSFWHKCDWIPCRDGVYRPVEPGTFPLAHGATARVGRLRAYGNAITPQNAQALIEAYLEWLG